MTSRILITEDLCINAKDAGRNAFAMAKNTIGMLRLMTASATIDRLKIGRRKMADLVTELKAATGKDYDAEYLEFDPFSEDRDVTIECRKVSLVRLRKPQTCVAGGLLDGVHTIEPGMVAKKESAKVDGVFGTCYHCLPCLGRLIAMNQL